MPPVESLAANDGRVQRGATSRERILQAIYEIVRSGQVRPTAEEVAERAQVGLRTVFRHFSDMDTLRDDLTARVAAEIRSMLLETAVPPDTLEESVSAICQRRARIFEHIAPFRRAVRINRSDPDRDRGVQADSAAVTDFIARRLPKNIGRRWSTTSNTGRSRSSA